MHGTLADQYNVRPYIHPDLLGIDDCGEAEYYPVFLQLANAFSRSRHRQPDLLGQ